MISTWKDCNKKFEYQYLLNQRASGSNVHLLAGGAFARGLETARRAFYEQGKSHEESVGIGLVNLIKAYGPEDFDKKSWLRMSLALEAYFDRYNMETDVCQPLYIGPREPGVRCYGIEFNFAIPLEIKHPETGDPILYSGRCDMLGTYGDGIYVVDEKTTEYLGGTWSSKWDLRGQFKGYNWAARLHGFNCQGAIVRGVAVRKAGGIDFAEAIIKHHEWQIEEWYEQLYRDINIMIGQWMMGRFDYNFARSCEWCDYTMICKAPPELRSDMLRSQGFIHQEWNPLEKHLTELVQIV
jgi:hypothetical protein